MLGKIIKVWDVDGQVIRIGDIIEVHHRTQVMTGRLCNLIDKTDDGGSIELDVSEEYVSKTRVIYLKNITRVKAKPNPVDEPSIVPKEFKLGDKVKIVQLLGDVEEFRQVGVEGPFNLISAEGTISTIGEDSWTYSVGVQLDVDGVQRVLNFDTNELEKI